MVPAAIVTGVGETLIELRVALVMVTEAEPETEFSVAVTLIVPAAVVVSNPLLPEVLLIEAFVGSDTLQCDEDVAACCVPSLRVAVAVNCCVCPAARVAEEGLMVMVVTTALVTVAVVVVVTLPAAAVMVVVPVWAATRLPVALTEAVEVEELDHVTELVRFCVLPSVKVPVAVSCWLVPAARLGLTGVIARELRAALVTVMEEVAVEPPSVAVMVAEPAETACTRPAVLTVATAALELV